MIPYYSTAYGQLYSCNCLKLLPEMPQIDLVVTSPPYDNLRLYNDYSFDFEAVAQGLTRILKPGGVIVWVVGDATVKGSETGTSFRQALYFKDVCGLNLHDTMIYQKQTPPLTHRRYEQHFEYMFILTKGALKTFNAIRIPKVYKDTRSVKTFTRNSDGSKDAGKPRPDLTNKIKGNVWKYSVGGGHVASNRIAHEHPAIFPEQLAADHISSWSNPGDVVFDPFMGSGTTAVMAQSLSRYWIGSEISEEYCEIAAKRLGGVL